MLRSYSKVQSNSHRCKVLLQENKARPHLSQGWAIKQTMLRKQHGSTRIKEATWTRNFLLDNQLELKLIHHRLHATFETQELRVENEDLALMNF